MAGRLEHEGAHDPERVASLPVHRLVGHPVAVQGRRLFPGQDAVFLPSLEQPGCLAITPVRQFHPDHVEQAAAQQLDTFLWADDVVGGAHHVVEGPGDSWIWAQTGKSKELGHVT